MSGFSQKDMMYGILGAKLADNKSSADVQLSRSELFRIGLFSALGGANNNPVFSMLSAKMSADDKIAANTATASNAKLMADNAQLIANIEKYKELIKDLKALPDADIANKFKASFDKDNNPVPEVAKKAASGVS